MRIVFFCMCYAAIALVTPQLTLAEPPGDSLPYLFDSIAKLAENGESREVDTVAKAAHLKSKFVELEVDDKLYSVAIIQYQDGCYVASLRRVTQESVQSQIEDFKVATKLSSDRDELRTPNDFRSNRANLDLQNTLQSMLNQMLSQKIFELKWLVSKRFDSDLPDDSKNGKGQANANNPSDSEDR